MSIQLPIKIRIKYNNKYWCFQKLLYLNFLQFRQIHYELSLSIRRFSWLQNICSLLSLFVGLQSLQSLQPGRAGGPLLSYPRLWRPHLSQSVSQSVSLASMFLWERLEGNGWCLMFNVLGKRMFQARLKLGSQGKHSMI